MTRSMWERNRAGTRPPSSSDVNGCGWRQLGGLPVGHYWDTISLTGYAPAAGSTASSAIAYVALMSLCLYPLGYVGDRDTMAKKC